MSVESEGNRPNQFGFSGGATAPEPAHVRDSSDDGEDVAVPADDLTGAISDGIDNATQGDDSESGRR